VALVTAPLLEVVPATPRSRLVTVDLRDHVFEFLPGQAVVIGAHGQPERRPYSIACSPEHAADTGRLELLMALEESGRIGPHLTSPTAGTLVDIVGPLGSFTFPDPPLQQRLLFVAGGTGIAPLRSMIDHALRRSPTHRLSVLYSARRGDEFAFIDELRRHERGGTIELHQTVTRDASATWSGGRGRIGRSHFETVLHDPATTLCFVCGPRAMVEEAVATLQSLGVPGESIRTEAWAVNDAY
jgi:NAD(P)H-flavin reductase